jgi:hypothetical protein
MDRKIIAQAHGLNLSRTKLDRIAGPLTELDQAFRPPVQSLAPGDEPDRELHLEAK